MMLSYCWAGRDRTYDLRINSSPLCRLSYSPKPLLKFIMLYLRISTNNVVVDFVFFADLVIEFK